MTGALAPEGNLRDAERFSLALHGGEEYELLFTARPDRRVPKIVGGIPITCIGKIVRGRQVKLVTPNGKAELLKPGGWQHFG